MDLHHLRVFRAAAHRASFTAAGKDLSLSQSTVSLHIKQLEVEFGAGLFVRSRKRVVLSEAGKVLLQYVDRIFAELHNAELAVREFSEVKRGTIRFGVGATTLIYSLPPVLAAFRRKYPHIEVAVTTGTTEVLLDALLANTLDLAVVMSPSAELSSVQTIPLQLEPLVIAMPPDHPLTATDTLNAADLAGAAWISHLSGTAMETVQQRLFAELSVTPHIVMELENMEAIKSLILSGMGISLLPRCTVSGPHARGIVIRELAGMTLSRELLLASVDWRAQPPATRRLARRIARALGPPAAAKADDPLIDQIDGSNEPFVVSAPKATP